MTFLRQFLCVWLFVVTMASPLLCYAQDYDGGAILHAQDGLLFQVEGEPGLNRRITLSNTGSAEFPLIGEVELENITLDQARNLVVARYADGYLVDPQVSLRFVQQRPVYVVGEVRFPGSFAFKDGFTVVDVVEKAGGYTYRADKDEIMLLRAQSNNKDIYKKVPDNTALEAGDIILIKERFF